jgi:hypothetical protein
MEDEDIAGPDILNRSVDELKLSMASMAALRGCYIQTVGELVQKTEAELLQHGIAPFEIKDFLANAGLSLGMRLDQNVIVITPGTAHLTITPGTPQLTVTPGTDHVGTSAVFVAQRHTDAITTPFGETPPKCATYLLYLFLSKHDRENIPGDLAEEYETIILPEFGVRKAKLWYWKQVICSTIIRSRLGRIVAVGGIAKAAHEIYKRLGS